MDFQALTFARSEIAAENRGRGKASCKKQCPGSEVIKHFLCSTQRSMKFQMPRSTNISRNSTFFRLSFFTIHSLFKDLTILFMDIHNSNYRYPII